ncbi:Platelet-activating factor acetylhydrolase IB gamma subunit [hydrothermal vent metagenome]|uniref:Platelet-activating factor acetylhydrolase IB gamma subunit n=1 Tax=hydrothermal vent metagenome TaxID=652676 RepID=A0A3B1DC45_9ZZZZ
MSKQFLSNIILSSVFVFALLCSLQTIEAKEGKGTKATLKKSLAPSKAKRDEKNNLLWYNSRDLTIEGQGWKKTEAPFDRLPAKAKKLVRKAVWDLSRHSAGICVRFVTDATSFNARWTLRSRNLAMPHMAATGVSGLDLYVKTEKGKWRWLSIGRPKKQKTSTLLISGIPAGTREYMLYLPLYNGVTSVEIGIPVGKKIAPASVRKKPIVFYGTSITHGCCASRTGMAHPSIIGRRFDMPIINLGFSGNGRMEAEVAKLMTEIDASVYVIDCLPNINSTLVKKRTEPLVKILRKAHPNTPILLVEDRNYANSFLVTSKRKRNQKRQKELKKAFDNLIKAGDKNLYYLEAEKLLSDDGDGTVDSSHPTDYGFVTHANAFEKVLKTILK